MENRELFRVSSGRRIKFKKPIILSQINTREILLRNDPKNFLHSISKSFDIKHRHLLSKKIKKSDIKGQIDLLSNLIDNYSSSSIKNLNLIRKLKDENDFLIDELNRNINKNTLFSKTTKETFHELVTQYEKRGYKIPNLTLERNLFKKSPLLIETKNDVDEFYKNDANTQGKFIENLDVFPEKNWNFLRKLKREVEKAGDINFSKDTGPNTMRKPNFIKERDFYSQQKALTERNEIKNIIKEIEDINLLIEKEEKEKYVNDDDFLTIIPKKDTAYNNTSKSLSFNIKELFKKKLTNKNIKKKSSYSVKNIKTLEIKKDDLLLKRIKKNNYFNKTNKGFYKPNMPKIRVGRSKTKTLITSLNEKFKSPFKTINYENKENKESYTEQVYQKINKKNLTDFYYVEDEIMQYLKKKNYKINQTNMNNFNKDFSQRVFHIKNLINKHALKNSFQDRILYYGNDVYEKLEKINNTEDIIRKMDKYFAKHMVDKYFDE